MKKIIKLFYTILIITLMVASFTSVSASLNDKNVEVQITASLDNENREVLLSNDTYKYGTSFEIEFNSVASEYIFLYWIIDGVVDLQKKDNEFIVSNDLEAIAVFHKEEEYAITFIDYSGKLIETKYLATNASLVNEPEVLPTKVGYIYNNPKWISLYGSSCLDNINESSVFKLNYLRETLDTITITVNGGVASNYSPLYNEIVTITSNIEDFTHWEENGVIVSYNENYCFSALYDRELIAKSGGVSESLVTLTNNLKLRNNYDSRLAQIYLNLDDSLIEHGFLVGDDELLSIDNGIIFKNNSLQPNTLEYLISFSDIHKYMYVRAYAIIKDNSETVKVIYSNVLIFKACQITFDLDYDNLIFSEETVKLNGKVPEPTIIPTREHYTFKGWYYEGEPFNFDIEITDDIILYAEFDINTYKLTLPEGVLSNQLNNDYIESGSNVLLNILLDEFVNIDKLLVNGVDVSSSVVNKTYEIISLEEDKVVEITYKYDLISASFISKATYSSGVDGNVNNYLVISNQGSSVVNVEYIKNNGSTHSIFNNNAKEIRLYPQNSSETNGSELKITLCEGYEIEKIIIDISDKNGGFSVNNSNIYTYTNSSQTIDLSSLCSEIHIKNISPNTGETGQVRIKSITIYYNKTIKRVLDTTPPVINFHSDDAKLVYRIGDVWNYDLVLSWISAIDNYTKPDDLLFELNDDNIYINGDNEIINDTGTYEITYYVYDSVGNFSIYRVFIKIYESIAGLLEEIDYSGFSGFYASLNNSSDIISDMAYLLRNAINYVTYGDARYFYVPYDEDTQVILYDYFGSSTYKLVPKDWGEGGTLTVNGTLLTIDREHVWACSDMRIMPINGSKSNRSYLGYTINNDSFDYRPANTNRGHYSDLHNLWNSVSGDNRSHSDKFYGDALGDSITPYLSGGMFYPGEEYKGDIARILFYMTLMYPYLTLVETDSNYGVGSIYYGYLDILLNWNLDDPVSDYEISRNNFIFNLQGNRNPFIDFYDEGFAEKLFIFGDPEVLDLIN